MVLLHADAGGQAAIYFVIRAGAETGLGGAQKGDELRHFLRFADAAKRMGRAEAPVGFLDVGIAAVFTTRGFLEDRRTDRARADRIDPDAGRRIVERQRARQRVDGALGGGIGGDILLAGEALDRGDVDDGAATAA